MKNKSILSKYSHFSVALFLIIIAMSKISNAGYCTEKAIWGHELNNKFLGKQVTEANVSSLANNFLQQNKTFLNIESNFLNLEKANYNMGNWYIRYSQSFNGIPVHHSHVGMSVKDTGEILALGTRFYHEISISTLPNISQENAVEIAKADFPYQNVQIQSRTLQILPEATDGDNFNYYLCWKIDLFSMEDAEGKTMFIDANTGNNIKTVENLRKSIGGTVYSVGSFYLHGDFVFLIGRNLDDSLTDDDTPVI